MKSEIVDEVQKDVGHECDWYPDRNLVEAIRVDKTHVGSVFQTQQTRVMPRIRLKKKRQSRRRNV